MAALPETPLRKQDAADTQRIRSEAVRYRKRHPNSSSDWTDIIESVISKYLNSHKEVDYSPAFVYMCSPFVACLNESVDIYHCFDRFMVLLGNFLMHLSRDEHLSPIQMHEQLSEFLMLLRQLYPHLYSHFEEEDIPLQEIATGWFQCLLAKELPLNSNSFMIDCAALMRLWDFYFAADDGFALHPFICLAILDYLCEQLEDLEQSQLKATLKHLPMMDMDQVLVHFLIG
jgi:hypothetical protein